MWEEDNLALALLCIRCIFIYALEEVVSSLPLVYGMKMLRLVRDVFGDVECVRKLLTIGLDGLREILKRNKLVRDIQVERVGNKLKIRVDGCILARQLHTRMVRKKHLCPWILTAILAMGPETFSRIRFTERYPEITEEGAYAEFEVVVEE
ncbi:MAG: hypothetical protein GXO23_02050 [Crenarchaeota archaeon]|nr:hypothetical protein [Thermoproteota archaeon]